MLQDSGQAGAEFEITEDMIEAGIQRLEHIRMASSEYLVTEIFLAMFGKLDLQEARNGCAPETDTR